MKLHNWATKKTMGMNGPITGTDLVSMALEESTSCVDGQMERLTAKIEKLGNIVGAMLDELPPAKALELAQLYQWELVE